ncbi:FRG domain-containing protein [Anaerocolumna jejuensis]|uniref:FRG domain-containing protein n=1 Tax=Anaerocolumna jejuensis TaxID=259063 RepID=UPI003F7B54C4
MFEMIDHPVKTIDVYKLSEFIDIMSDGIYENYFYRGESKHYEHSICSTLLRTFTKPNGRFLPVFYEHMLNEFFREVANDISDIEKEHFIAFCQHHGLKTNLIDITTSPIIALYFACDMNNDFLENNIGYMYLINKDKCIDISQSLLKNKKDFSIVPFSFNEITHKSRKSVLEFAKVICSYINKENGEIFFLVNQLRTCCNDLYEGQAWKYLNCIATRTRDIESTQMLDILNEIQDEYSKKYNLDEITMPSAKDFMILLLLYLEDIILQSNKDSNKDFIFPKLPYFTYQTPYKFDRIKNQEALFIYQLYLPTTSFYMDDVHKNMIQKIEPDIILRIHNQEKIIKDLDSIGINRKMIYGDVDNTAKYINDKFLNDVK